MARTAQLLLGTGTPPLTISTPIERAAQRKMNKLDDISIQFDIHNINRHTHLLGKIDDTGGGCHSIVMPSNTFSYVQRLRLAV
jgi:hypothetical protein